MHASATFSDRVGAYLSFRQSHTLVLVRLAAWRIEDRGGGGEIATPVLQRSAEKRFVRLDVHHKPASQRIYTSAAYARGRSSYAATCAARDCLRSQVHHEAKAAHRHYSALSAKRRRLEETKATPVTLASGSAITGFAVSFSRQRARAPATSVGGCSDDEIAIPNIPTSHVHPAMASTRHRNLGARQTCFQMTGARPYAHAA